MLQYKKIICSHASRGFATSYNKGESHIENKRSTNNVTPYK